MSDFFIENSYTDPTGRTLPCYLITSKSCDMISNKLTGKKGTEFTAKYINAFYAMEQHIQQTAITTAKPVPENKSGKLIMINHVELYVRKHNGKRVITLEDIDAVHERPEGTARKRFNDNKKHFVEGEDYFKICSDEIRRNKIFDISSKVQSNVILITESGYYMLVKSFTDELSW